MRADLCWPARASPCKVYGGKSLRLRLRNHRGRSSQKKQDLAITVQSSSSFAASADTGLRRLQMLKRFSAAGTASLDPILPCKTWRRWLAKQPTFHRDSTDVTSLALEHVTETAVGAMLGQARELYRRQHGSREEQGTQSCVRNKFETTPQTR